MVTIYFALYQLIAMTRSVFFFIALMLPWSNFRHNDHNCSYAQDGGMVKTKYNRDA